VLNKKKAVLTHFGKFSQVKAQEKFLSIKKKKIHLADVVLTNKISFNDQTVVTLPVL
jgi:outer membrane protein insertion porin family